MATYSVSTATTVPTTPETTPMIVIVSALDEPDELDDEDIGLMLWCVAIFITSVVGLGPYVNNLLEMGEPSAVLPNNNWEQNESQTEVAVAPSAELKQYAEAISDKVDPEPASLHAHT